MKAAVFHGPHQPLTIEQVDIDDPQDHEVLVRTAATGVCHSDLHFVEGLYPQTAPAILGHEAAGIVEKVGKSVTYLKAGDHVISCPSVFCGYCEECMSGHPNRCNNRQATQRPRDGKPRLSQKGAPVRQFSDLSTYAEKMLVHENALCKIVNEMPLDRAALIGCGVTTGVGAVLNTAKIEPGCTVAVFGCGGVGISAIQGARIGGARRIIAVDQFENKLAMAKRFGATDTIDASHTDALKEIRTMTNGGVDYAFEAVGVKKLAEQCFDATKVGGTAVIIGMIPVGQKVEIDGPRLLTERTLKGSMMGSNRFRIDMPRYIDFYMQGRLNLDDMVSKRGKLEDINDAFGAMKRGEVARTVLTFDPFGDLKMEYRKFGKTGIDISAIGFGCWEIGGGYGSIEETDFIRAVNRALDAGLNSYDTAEAYGFGASEKSLAKALGKRRKEAVITTKFGVGYPDKPNYRDSTRQRVMESIEKSLKALETDYVDVYLIHWPDRAVPFEEPMRALDDLVKQGKVKAVGLSNFKLNEIEECMKVRRVDVVQYCWNMFDRRMQKEIFPYCRDNHIGVMAYGSLAYGMLTGTLSEEKAFEKGDWRSRRGQLGNINLFQHLFGPDHFLKNLRAVEELKGVAKRYNKTLPQLALRWTTSNPVVSTALVGCRNPGEVDDNLGALGWTISDADMKEIDAIFARNGAVTMPETWLES